MEMNLRTLWQTTRPPFLVLTLVCVALGASSALASGQPLDVVVACLVLIAALCVHISVNALNEYQDFRSGLDLTTVRTPFSGGSGALPAAPTQARAVLVMALLALVIAIGIGVYLLMHSDARLFGIGAAGCVLVLSYTPWLNRQPWLCLLAPGTGFGLLMVPGTHLVLAGPGEPLPWALACIPFALVNNVLLLNQYPDRAADQRAGRRTFPVVYGVRASHVAYAAFALLAYGLLAALVLRGQLPALAWLALLPAVLSIYALWGALQHGEAIGQHPQFLAANVAAALLTPALLALGIGFS